MTRTWRNFAWALALGSLGGLAGGCASTKSGLESAAATPAAASAATALAGKVGVSPTVAQAAVTAAQGYLAKTPQSSDDKQEAARQGAEAADKQALQEGQPLTEGQKVSLGDALRGIL